MRFKIFPQMKLGEIPISDIQFNINCRHELVRILKALQHLYVDCQPVLHQILDLIEKDVIAGKVARPDRGCIGLSYWEILVLTAVRLGCNLNYDELSDLADNHRKLREMLMISPYEAKVYPRSTINDNLRFLKPQTISMISFLIAQQGQGFSSADPLRRVRGDTFVLRKNIHYPTDTNLLHDAIRKIIELSVKLANENLAPGWRKHQYWRKKAKAIRRKIEKTAKSRQKDRDDKLKNLYHEFMEVGQNIVDRALDTIHSITDEKSQAGQALSRFHLDLISELQYFIAGAEYVSELARRRVFENEEIPNADKVFSLFEPGTELINRGKSPNPIEFGHRVLIVQDSAGFIIHSSVLGNGLTDEKIIVEVMKKLQRRYNNRIRAASFDKGFWTPNNLKELSPVIPLVVLPKKGKRSLSDMQREGAKEFGEVRKWHSGIESAIHALVSGNGLDLCRDKGVDGYDRYVAMAVLGRNLHNLGNILIEKERKKRKKEDRYSY